MVLDDVSTKSSGKKCVMLFFRWFFEKMLQMYLFFVYILSEKTLEKSFTFLIAWRDRFIYQIIILICGFGLLECLFLHSFLPDL